MVLTTKRNDENSKKAIINSTFSRALEVKGWKHESMGQFRSSGKTKNKEGFQLYIRRRNLNQYIVDYSKKSTLGDSGKPCKYWTSEAGSSSPMGVPEARLTPSTSQEIGSLCDGGEYLASSSQKNTPLPKLSSFSDYPSLLALRTDKPCLLIGYDSEWENIESGREMLSWQFSLVDGEDLVEFVFLKDGDRNLSLMEALGCILDHIDKYKPVDHRNIRRYKYCAEWKNNKPLEIVTDDVQVARKNCKYVFRNDIGFTHELIQEMPDNHSKRCDRDWACYHTYLDYSVVDSIKVCMVCHSGKGDLSALSYGDKDLLCHLTEVQGGLVSLQPVKYAPKSLKDVNAARVYPVLLSIADTMCHAPAKKKKLADLGKVLGVEKIDIGTAQMEHMKGLLTDNPDLYMEYASTDSVVTVLYASALYGYNNALPVTITSATAGVMKETMMKHLGCESMEEFNRVYRGVEKVKHGKHNIQDLPGFVEPTSLEPISNDASAVQQYASKAYHGGYNNCTEVGHFRLETYDYDLQNAYPTAMSLVQDIDWENPIRNEVYDRELTLADFTDIGGINPITPFVGYVRFEFPDSVKYPCIPVNVDGIPLYPLTSEGMDGVYVAGPFVWLALKLGAHVYCDRGYFLNVRHEKDCSQESRSLAIAVKQLVVDRNLAKLNQGKDSLEELILKIMVNSGYGKTAQNVIQKTGWTALRGLMENIGCSAITNPVSAMMTTSIVQVELLAAQNQLHDLGYMSCSVTTDGLITDCPEDTMKKLDLYGLRKFMEGARLFLTDGRDPELWEIKHHQDDLVNFTTRGNVSLRCKDLDGYDGVCAHNSTKSGYKSDSFEDRLWLMTQVLSRTGTVAYTDEKWTSFKDLVQGKPFMVKPRSKHIHMDFDMKRKPIRESFTTDKVIVEGTEYEIAHFDTEPFKNIKEFLLYRKKKELVKVLRTQQDWDVFWLKLDLNATGAQPRNMEWAILNSCIMGYRSGKWDIPGLNDKTIEEKCVWINSHNSSDRKFKPSDWKNARRPERQSHMLPLEMIGSKLEELMNAGI